MIKNIACIQMSPLGRGQVFVGGSGILNPWGKFLSGPKYGKEEILQNRIDLESWQARNFQSRGMEARDDLLSLSIATESYRPLYEKNRKRIRFRPSN